MIDRCYQPLHQPLISTIDINQCYQPLHQPLISTVVTEELPNTNHCIPHVLYNNWCWANAPRVAKPAYFSQRVSFGCYSHRSASRLWGYIYIYIDTYMYIYINNHCLELVWIHLTVIFRIRHIRYGYFSRGGFSLSLIRHYGWGSLCTIRIELTLRLSQSDTINHWLALVPLSRTQWASTILSKKWWTLSTIG